MSPALRAAAAVCLAIMSAAPAQAQLDTAGGGTVVTVEGSTVKITVNVDVPMQAPGDDLLEQVRAYVEPGFAAAANYWNEALGDRLADACFAVEIAVNVRMLEFGQPSGGGGHDIHVLHDFDPHFDSPQLTTESTNDDTAQVFHANGTGYLPPWLFQVGPSLLAHELGHMFGLGDDYVRGPEGNPVTLPGREGTLMDSGHEIDDALADRVVDLAKRSGTPVPDCRWEGSGLVAQTPLDDGARTLTRSAEFTFWFNADPDGTIAGEITLTYDAVLTVARLPRAEVGIAGFDPRVGGQVTDPSPTRTFPLEGTLDDTGLTLRIGTPEAEREQIMFTIAPTPASAPVSARAVSFAPYPAARRAASRSSRLR